MEWFKGGVASAIESCRQNKSLFVVYVYDDSPASKTTDEAWESSQVLAVMSANSYVALRLLKDSLECRQFSQLFPVFLYPSVFCIGMTGQVLVSMTGVQTPSQLADKLSEGFKKLQAELSPPSAQAPPSSVVTTPPQDSPAPPLTVTTPTLVDINSEEDPPQASPPSLDEKVQRAKELIKQRRAEKEEQLFEKEKSQELKRREMGKETAKFKKVHEDRQAQDWIRERQKQKEDARKAREEVRAKLEQDKLERQARAAASQRERGVSSTPTTSPAISSVSTSGMCRVQLKLPTGGNVVLELNRTDTLAVLRQRAAQELDTNEGSVTLLSTFPSKELTRELDEQTMIQLQLVPSGVVMVRMKKGFVSSLKGESGGGGSSVWGFFTYVFQLIVWFLTFIKNGLAGLFGGGSSRESTDNQHDIRRERLSALGSEGRGGGGRGEATGGPRLRKFRQEDYQDESDEERRKQTYNGNSTQQQ